MAFRSLPFEARPVKATEAVLERIARAAESGVTGDALAFAADLLPIELRRLEEFDPLVANVIAKARADNWSALLAKYQEAALAGDAKAIEWLLKHVHKMSAPQSISVEVNQTISILGALEKANARVDSLIIEDAISEKPDEANRPASLPVNQERLENEQANYNARTIADDV